MNINEIREEIRNSGFNQSQISAMSGIPQATISRFFAGQCDIGLAKMVKLAESVGFVVKIERVG